MAAAGGNDMGTSDGGVYKMFTGRCPDKQCRATLFFPAHDNSIECTSCGQRHSRKAIQNIAEVTNPEVALHNILKNILLGTNKPRKCSDTIKVLGYSNYQCKMLSPFLTEYGMEKQTGKAKKLEEMGQNKTFDCGVLADRAFLIEPEHMEIDGYGRDKTGSVYLKNTMEAIQSYNENQERLLPVHADGDGHCLVHAVSRALIGRELFWHALRENLQEHFKQNLDSYKAMFYDFVDQDEWGEIIAECDPLYIPANGEPMGLRNLHIFGLANVLRRPIILLDSLSGIQSSGDYSGVFLPGLVPPERCHGKDGAKHPPLCIAWSSSARNHYIALVPVKGRRLPVLPAWMTRKSWGMPSERITSYIDTDKHGAITIGGHKCLHESYIGRLVQAMETVFVDTHGVSTALVADVHQYLYKSTGMVGTKPEVVIAQTKRALDSSLLYRCLTCDALTEWRVPREWFRPGGTLYTLATKSHGTLNPNKQYSFPMHGILCGYDEDADELYAKWQDSHLLTCQWCQGVNVRRVRADGSPAYENGDRTSVRAPRSRCSCGYKHYWDGKLYDNKPEEFPIALSWGGRQVAETVAWFQYESDAALNSNVYQVAQSLVDKHFPGEFGSERLVQDTVDKILAFTQHKAGTDAAEADMGQSQASTSSAGGFHQNVPMKTILTGQQRHAVHKEELNKSETEKKVRENIEAKAPQNQKRKTDELKKEASAGQGVTPGSSQGGPSPANTHVKHMKTTEPASNISDTKAMPSAQDPTPRRDQDKDVKSQGAVQKVKKVKVTTNDSRQLMLTLPQEVTYSTLMETLVAELQVPEARIRVKCGFPPKLIQPPITTEDQPGTQPTSLPIQNGDRLSVEILPNPSAAPTTRVPENLWPVQHESPRNTWSQFDATTRETNAQQMLRSLQDLQDSKSDSIDTSIASLVLMATLQRRDVWTMVQTMPHLFSVGGLFYEQVKKDVGLVEAKHYTLPAIPGKVFRYDDRHERLELCLEPHGHFPIAPGIEAQVLNTSLITMAHQQGMFSPGGVAAGGVARDVGLGSSGVVVGRAEKTAGKTNAFQGQGHSMKSSAPPMDTDSHMPKELSPTARKRRQAMRFRKISQSSRENSIEEMDESETGPLAVSASSNSHSQIPELSEMSEDSDRALVSQMISLANSLTSGYTRAEGEGFDPSPSSMADFPELSNQSTSAQSSTLDCNKHKTPQGTFRKIGPGYTVLDTTSSGKPGGSSSSSSRGCNSGNGRQRDTMTRTPSEEFTMLTRSLEALAEAEEGGEDDMADDAVQSSECTAPTASHSDCKPDAATSARMEQS